jgi:hypothetical protein
MWTALTPAVVTNAMPTDLATLYAQWLETNPSKSGRLAEIVTEVVATFRSCVESNAKNTMDNEDDTVPTSGFRHALHEAIFHLGMEMGVAFSDQVAQLKNESEIWLRQVQSGTIAPVGLREGTPTFTLPEDLDRQESALTL